MNRDPKWSRGRAQEAPSRLGARSKDKKAVEQPTAASCVAAVPLWLATLTGDAPPLVWAFGQSVKLAVAIPNLRLHCGYADDINRL